MRLTSSVSSRSSCISAAAAPRGAEAPPPGRDASSDWAEGSAPLFFFEYIYFAVHLVHLIWPSPCRSLLQCIGRLVKFKSLDK
eukprot:6683465-Heterocapsa_arctica.AAC.1